MTPPLRALRATLRLCTPVASLRGQPARQGSATAVRRRQDVAMNAIVLTGGASCSLCRLRGMSSRLLTHAGCQPLRLPLRYAHRGPLHPGRYGTRLHRPSMRFTTRAVFAATPLTCATHARLKSHATRPVTTHSPRVMPFAETARAPRARYARRSPTASR